MSTPITMEALTLMLHQMEHRINLNVDTKMQQMEQHINYNMDTKMQQMEQRMDTKMQQMEQRLDTRIDGLTHEVSKMSILLDKHDMEIDYIKRNVKLGTCKSKSFVSDGWKLSSLFMPAIQCASAYVIAYAVSSEKNQ